MGEMGSPAEWDHHSMVREKKSSHSFMRHKSPTAFALDFSPQLKPQ
jgi:hypothetical protein